MYRHEVFDVLLGQGLRLQEVVPEEVSRPFITHIGRFAQIQTSTDGGLLDVASAHNEQDRILTQLVDDVHAMNRHLVQQ